MMGGETGVKKQVREFYDQVGWQVVGDGLYQNARYEDLRPVAREYIHRCHLRVNRHLSPNGRFLLDAGSGPVQYPEYLTYSQGYAYRVCADISIVALQEARKRLGQRGLYVVADVANLPFKTENFEGIVSLHTLHHLPLSEQRKAYAEIYRVLAPQSQAVVVNGWTESVLMKRWKWLERWMSSFGRWAGRRRSSTAAPKENAGMESQPVKKEPTGTFVEKLDAAWLRRELAGKDFEIRVWRSISVRFSRAVFHSVLGGKYWLRLLYWLEERFPHYFGENGQYPLVILRKDA
jgi:ubiquinone/menaquinone biosynthesis C-methylase UbiE